MKFGAFLLFSLGLLVPVAVSSDSKSSPFVIEKKTSIPQRSGELLLIQKRLNSRSELLNVEVLVTGSPEKSSTVLCHELEFGKMEVLKTTPLQLRCSKAVPHYRHGPPLIFVHEIVLFKHGQAHSQSLSYDEPKHPWQHLNLAWWLLQHKLYKDAQTHYREGLFGIRNDPAPLHPNLQAELWLDYAKALKENQRQKPMRKMLQMILKYYPESPSAPIARKRLRQAGT